MAARQPTHSAFGDLLVPVETLSFAARVDVLRREAGELLGSIKYGKLWMGAGFTRWLADGGDLAAALGLRPPKGNRTTAQNIVRMDQRDRALLRLSAGAGGDRAAVRILAGQVACPPALQHEVVALREMGALPRSAAAFTRARKRVSRVR